MTKEKIDREEAAKVRIFIWLMFMGAIMITMIIAQHLHSDEMVHKFKSPSFSGIGTSAHYLTIENQQFNRKQALKAEIKALQDEIERDKEFISQLSLSVYILHISNIHNIQVKRTLKTCIFPSTGIYLKIYIHM